MADPGTPDFRSARHYLFWLARQQRATIVAATAAATVWMLSQALLWAAVGGAVDHGIAGGHASQLWRWAGLILLLGVTQAVSGALRHQLAVTNWMRACYRTVQVVGRHITTSGTALTDAIPSGDIVNSVGADAPRIGMAFDSLARFIGAIISWLIVSLILVRSSHLLGLIVLIGVPTLAILTTPMMKPLHAAQSAQREATGRLAALGTDTVAGLRILRGIGGEEVFASNYNAQSDLVRRAGVRAAVPQAALESGQLLLPAILTSVVTFIGAREVARGTLQPGQLVSFFGYATFLTTPLREVIQYSIMATRAYVGAGKVVRLLRVTPTVGEPDSPREWPTSVEVFEDVRSGVRLVKGQIAAVVTETPAESAELADRLGRFTPDVAGVCVNGTQLADFSLADTRRHVVVNDIEPRLFSGRLRYELVPHDVSTDERILAALNAVSALDILDALDDGLETRVDERGRSFSGGQRQRLALARALLTNADVLILVEPTSAVDTHTEGRIAARLAAMRRSHATLVTSTSPLMLERMDHVFLVADGRVVAQGTHHDLAASSPLYRQIVLREDS